MPNPTDHDPFDLERFVVAQQADYPRALDELRHGRKRTHWMWYIFPQFVGLGTSHTSQLYAITSLDEARAYLAHRVLGPRLIDCMEILLSLDGRSANDIFSSPDDLKLRSCATLFAHISAPASVFQRVLDRYFASKPDPRTVALLSA